ncbi:MAG: F0F1 ATP synthase subunit delta [Sphingomonadaceae bacterium]
MPAVRSGIAKRYAEAVFEIAKSKDSFDEWARDLADIAEAQRNPQIATVVAAPTIGLSTKEAVIARCLADISPEASNLVKLLLRRGRFALAPQIAAHYRKLVNDHRGIATAEVTSAVPLSAAELDAVAGRLSAMTGRRVVVEPCVDPSILGGIVARIGDQLIDASVRGRLEALKRRLSQA